MATPDDPELAAAVAFTRAMSRRRFLSRSGLGLGAAILAPRLLTACSQPTDEFTVSNWVAYIDEDDNGDIKGPGTTIEDFEKSTGITINYLTDFNDNDEYFNRSFSPMLGRGKAIAADIAVPSSWMAARLISLGWTEKLLLDRIPNHANVEDAYVDLDWDPGATSHMPWQGGIGGIAYDPEITGRELVSANDLFDPAFKGQIAMLTELRDSVGLTMFAMGNDPAAAKPDEVHAALDKIEEATKGGQILKFTGNEYLQDLSRGELAACVAWSGDIYSLESDRDIRFIVPEEGGTDWFDTMVVPKGAQRQEDAAAWMNFVYDPENAARITAWVGYKSPVKGVREALEAAGGDLAAVAEDPLVFTDDETQKRLRVFGPLEQKDEIEIQTRFNDLTG